MSKKPNDHSDNEVPNLVISRSVQRTSRTVPVSESLREEGLPSAEAAKEASVAPGSPEPSLPASEASKDPAATTVFLPSRFEFYPFKSISVLPVGGFHQAKFSRAAKEKLTRHVVEAVSTLLPEGIDAADLTVPDFYFILYWLRLNCYTRAQLVHKGVCRDHKHVAQVREGKKPADSLVNLVTVTKTSLKQEELPHDYLGDWQPEPSLLEKADYYPCTMRDVISLEEDFDDLPPESMDELEYLADLASFIRIKGNPEATLRERIQLLEKANPDELESIALYRQAVSNYGVEEFIKFKCKECGAETETAISISAHSFL